VDQERTEADTKRAPVGESQRVVGALVGLLLIVAILVPTFLFAEDRFTRNSAYVICGVIAAIHLKVIASSRRE